jgi:CRISPR/Cas system-associated protein endoribonuclease Cas2
LLGGVERIRGKLLKLGFEVGQSSVAKYMVKRCGPPSQGWRTFLRNHAPDIGAMDLLVVPTLGFDLLYVLVTAGPQRPCLDRCYISSDQVREEVNRRGEK